MKPVRIQLSRVKGWRMPENTVKVTRPGRYGNPFRASDTAKDGVAFAVQQNGFQWLPDSWWTSKGVVEMFRQWVTYQPVLDCETGHPIPPGVDLPLVPNLELLRGMNLACWCKLVDEDGKRVPCHADVLLELANEPARSEPEIGISTGEKA